MSHSRNRRLRRPRWLRWPKWPKKAARKAGDIGSDCATPDCDLRGCDGCDCGGCDLTLFGFFISGMFYFSTPPVLEGPRTMRPALRLIRSYQRNVSAHRPAVCNLSPTCSRFGYETLRDTGWRGVRTVRERLTECRVTGQQRCSTHNATGEDHS
jgi:putative component of membrane protein insertase Oxa1/YidC/SpoIIIJ protein YidD